MHKFILFMLGIMFLGACGTADVTEDVPSDSPVTVIEVEAENWQFNKKVYKVFADQPITINFKSEEGEHEFAIKGMEKVRIKGGGSIKKIFEAGEYQIYCPIAQAKGHYEMVATLIAVQKNQVQQKGLTLSAPLTI
ncbi:cupredoxin domain-containing protein [Pseudalkalibacillus salsuginis]|uniref:cupredoxin domain-containing protein n=1 Tax=Pseudalkalibacillus salsuginis TaxID=2910972 RepID=UPI001F3B3BD3|nr:cupredoxin domain-containing protein [Pseudalkalibacillus salsuginis]MCF6409304.1 cupredoxin domain-containing protein [Pseudalkalibacillus salsuginis]